MSTVAYPHIEFSKDGVPLIAGTTTKVVEVVLDHLAHHWDAEEIQRQHPHLSLSAIYSALAYYHDHQEEIDRDIAERLTVSVRTVEGHLYRAGLKLGVSERTALADVLGVE